ncbi:HTH-type transcriptional activator RhaR [compost metagenome]
MSLFLVFLMFIILIAVFWGWLDYRTNRFSANYCGMNDRPFMASSVVETTLYSCFAIRFHFWAIHLFADYHLRDSLNICIDSDVYFHGWSGFFEDMMSKTRTIKERIPIAEQFLLSKLKIHKSNNNVLNAAYSILNSKGTIPIKDVCSYTAVSQRQIERLFLHQIGMSVKKVSSLVRYQHVWQDVAYSREFDIQDAVVKYGYADQSHLINEFKKYHSMTPIQAKKRAFKQL